MNLLSVNFQWENIRNYFKFKPSALDYELSHHVLELAINELSYIL